MTRETASREISRLAGKGLIQNANGYIIIKDLTALQRQVSKSFRWPANSVNLPCRALKLS